jgi:hypothetical protein
MLAEHSAHGDVTDILSDSDDSRVDLLGAIHNNGASESVQLEFFAFPGLPVDSFFFEIEGSNAIVKVM